MAPLTRPEPRQHPGRLDIGALLTAALLLTPAVHAQIAEVIRPDAQGDFRSIRIAGARGAYPQRFWLVVDRDPRGLLCRDPDGRAWISLRYGAVLELDLPEQQNSPRLIQGKPYLRMVIKPVDLLDDARFQDRGQPTACFVRANSAFLAPIHPDSLEQIRLRP